MQDESSRNTVPLKGMSRRDFLGLCSSAALTLGLVPSAAAHGTSAVVNPAGDQHANHCRYRKLTLHDSGIFRGTSELRFKAGRNVILGDNGAGKSTIVRALSGLSLSPRATTYRSSLGGSVVAHVETHGNPELITRYSDLVFLDEQFVNGMPIPGPLQPGRQRCLLDDNALGLFLRFRPSLKSMLKGRNLAEVLTCGYLGMGDRVMAGLSYNFAARSLLGVDIPIVMDSLYSCLDDEYSVRLSEYLRLLPSQVIMLVNEAELSRSGGQVPTHRLERGDGCTYARNLWC